MTTKALFFCGICCLLFSGCTEAPTEPSMMVDNGSWYVTGFRWPHDGKPYESDHFVVYSDAASLESRKILAEAGEEVFTALTTELEITDPSIFRYPEGRTKIHIYAYRNYFPPEWGGRAYHGGFMIFSLDHKERGEDGDTELNVYLAVVKHELTHVIQSLIFGRVDNTLVDVWLSEGLAETISKSNPERKVDSLDKLNALISKFGALNPIAMHLYNYPDIDRVGVDYYYPMFQLAVTYLTDPEGRGRTMPDIKHLFLDIRDGMPFSTAFEKRFGISLADYEEHFFDLMNDYLK